MARLAFAVALIAGMLVAKTAAAQDVQEITFTPPVASPAEMITTNATRVSPFTPTTFPSRSPSVSKVKRSSAMTWLYASTVTMEALDIHSTLMGIRSGNGVESNPLMAGIVRHPALLIATKGALTTSTILGTRRLAQHHPRAGVITLIAINATYAAVAAHNYRLGRSTTSR